MAILRLSRGSEWLCGGLELNIYVDDNKIGVVKKNNYKDFTVNNGELYLQVKVGGFASKKIKIEIKSNQHAKFWVEMPRMLPLLATIHAIFDNKLIVLKPSHGDSRVIKYD